MNRPRVVAIASAACLLAACSSGADAPARDSCNALQAWVSEGEPVARLPEVLGSMGDDVDASDEQSIKDAYARLVADVQGEPEAAGQAAGEFLETCRDLGWDLPEG